MYKRQTSLIFISIIFIVALLTACERRNEAIPTLSVQYALDEALARRENIVRPGDDEIVAAIRGRSEDWRWEGIANVFSETPLLDVISTEDALYDAQTLLVALRQMYAPYIYFGGDDVFIPLFDEIKAILSSRDYWDTMDFSIVVRDKLFSVAVDNHFLFAPQLIEDIVDLNYLAYVTAVTATFFTSDVPFIRTSNGFSNNEKNMYVSEIAGHNKYDVFRLAVDEYGTLFYAPVPFGLNHFVSFNAPGEIIQREQLLILLTDRFTGSSGEFFTDLAFSLGNSLVIGQNTGGFLIGTAPSVLMTLPRSGVQFGFGEAVFIHPQGHFAEGFGFAPDIWATGDALESALNFISHYQAIFQYP